MYVRGETVWGDMPNYDHPVVWGFFRLNHTTGVQRVRTMSGGSGVVRDGWHSEVGC
jgi:hypothetical protein